MFLFNDSFFKKKDEYLIYISIISIGSFSSAIHSINSFRLVTGSFIGILIFIFFLNKIKNFETRKIISLSVIIFLCLGINFKKSENNKLYVTSASSEYSKNNEIKFFKNLKFKKDTWNHTLFFNKKINEISQKCIDVNYAINYTNNTQLYITRALSPAKINSLNIDEEKKTVQVYLNPDEVSRAIGKGGHNIRLAGRLTGYEIDVYREGAEEDVELTEFKDEIDGWVIEEFRKVGLDTAKSVLELEAEDLVKRTDLEEETVADVLKILKEEFED